MKKEITVTDFCLTCNEILREDINIKRQWHKPLCNKCREILLNYHLKKEKIDRIMRARFVKEKGL